MSSIPHTRAVIGLLLSASALFTTTAAAVEIGATANLTNGSLSSIDLSFADNTSQTPGTVTINEFTSVTGSGSGTVLGQAIVNGDTNGLFDLSVFGQEIHAHESGFQFTDTITNTAAVPQALTMDFLINAGELETIVREAPPAPGEFLDAGYEVVISFMGVTVFESRVSLRHEADPSGTASVALLSQSGTDLGGQLTPVSTRSRDEYSYTWGPYTETLNLGVLGAGQAGVLEYAVRTFVETNSVGNSTRASIGDPFNVSWIGGEGTFGFSPLSAVSSLDIQPGNEKNFVNPHSRQLVRVAVLGSDGFDATQVDASTVAFGPNGAAPVRGGAVRDVNGDGYPDMLFGFRSRKTGIACADTEASLSGETFGGEQFSGTDSVITVGCNAPKPRPWSVP